MEDRFAMKKMVAIVAAAYVVSVALVLATVMFLGYGRKTESSAEVMYSYPLPSHIEFRSPERQERELPRSVVRSPEGKLVSATVPYERGKTAYIEYWTEGPGVGRIHTARVLYPEAEGSKERQVARELEYQPNGIDVKRDRIYRPNGKLQHSGDAVFDQYETFDYAEDGQAIMKHEKFACSTSAGRSSSSPWYSVSLTEYYASGVIAHQRERSKEGPIDEHTFSEQGLLQMHRVSNVSNTNVTTELYEADGKNLKTEIIEFYQIASVKSFVDGKPAQVSQFRYSYNVTVPNALWVGVYNSNGVLAYQQQWVLPWDQVGKVQDDPNHALKLSMFKLQEIQYLDANGKMEKDIDLYDDQTTAKAIEIRLQPGSERPYPRINKIFRADGTLEKLKEYSATGEVIKVEKHGAEENIREAVDPEALKMREWIAPPNTIKRDGKPLSQ